MPILCLEEVVDLPSCSTLTHEERERENQGNAQRYEPRGVRREQDDDEESADELPGLPAERREVVAALTTLRDADEDQGEDDGEWQQGGGHDD